MNKNIFRQCVEYLTVGILVFWVVFFVRFDLSKDGAFAVGEQYGDTPISDLNLYPRPQNAVQTMSYLIFNPTSYATYKDYISKEIDYLWFDQSSLAVEQPDGSYNFSGLYNAASELHSLNPNIKVGTHAGGAGRMATFHVPFKLLDDTDFLHDS